MEINKKCNFHSVYNLKYHLVLVTKYRKKCINNILYQYLFSLTKELCNKWDVELIEINHDLDHIHMMLEIPPQVQISKFVNNYKTVTSRLMRKDLKEYLDKFYWKDNFWSKSYMILSCGEAPIEIIREYIKNKEK